MEKDSQRTAEYAEITQTTTQTLTGQDTETRRFGSENFS